MSSPWQEITEEWRDFNKYDGGDTVLYQGAVYEARNYADQQQVPGELDSPWQELTDEWRNFNEYQAGETVWHNGQQFMAKWWTHNSEPGVGPAWDLVE